MADIHIEQVAPTDLAQVVQLFTEQVYPAHPEEAHSHFAGHTQGQADTFLAWIAGSLAGYLTIRWQSNNPQFRQRNIPLIHHLRVFPQFQRQGIASRLMDAAEQLIATRATQGRVSPGPRSSTPRCALSSPLSGRPSPMARREPSQAASGTQRGCGTVHQRSRSLARNGTQAREESMKLVAMTYGTEGDTRPIAALCRALMDAGHEVTLLAGGGTLSTARDLSVTHAPLEGDIRGALQPGSGISSVVAGKNNLNATAQTLARLANENADAWMRQVLDAAAGSNRLIVAGLAAFIGFSAAEKLGIPIIGAGMIPLTPTSAFPSPFLPPRSMPRWLNRFSYRLVAEVLWHAFRNATNAARAKVGLPPGHKLWSGHPMLYAISPTLLPEPGDWPNNAWMCGQWMRPVREWNAPQSLRDFLSTGEAPLYVGFGSMVGFDQRTLLDVVVAAVAGLLAGFYPAPVA